MARRNELHGALHRCFIISLLVAAVPAAAAEADAGFGGQLVRVINGYRATQGLAPLALDDRLVELAQQHSQSMAAQQRLSHDGFQARFADSGSTACVENVAWNQPTAEAVFEDWRQSPPHQANLLDAKVRRVGIARHAGYATYFACR